MSVLIGKEEYMYKIVLASGSPRRREILEQIGVTFSIITSEKEEVMDHNNPEKLVKDLSEMKTRDVADKVVAPAIVIGADTVVAQDGRVLGKPKNEEHAKEMLTLLQNNSHEVYTGVFVIIMEEDGTTRDISMAVATKVMVAAMNEQQIEDYIATKEPMDKAGSYAIQGIFAPYILGIEGDYYNIVGFPIGTVYQKLYEMGIDLRTGEKII